ncbi:protein kinase domain-containing protein [Enhygromyxa salina]|uniref:Serine/threonine-protein kinase StkP n=1 Tax=Enhygromyxa salina TaxID=215803 RepID=A0A2S9YWX2_9BACT|nr:protein kinase [Enhygromyxa salina]PRQ09587.1 Serine/threonine-protein kinase StkP [Enhygromyxa salina]
MQEIPIDLVAAIQAGDCVLWTGAGIGALIERPSWAALLAELAASAEPDPKVELEGLLARGDRLTVLDWLRRHQSDALEAALGAKIEDDTQLPPSLTALGQLRWRGCLATVYPDLLARARQVEGHDRPRVSRDASKGMPSDHVLHTSLSRDLRRDHDLRELVEEVVRTSTLVLLGFELGDPDLRQILAILRRIPATGGPHYLFLPEIGVIEAEQLRERSGLSVCALPDGGIAGLLEQITSAVGDERTESRASERLAALELSRVLRPVPLRVDVGVDAAFAVDPHEVDLLVEALPGGIESLPGKDLLRLGSVWLAHARVSGKTQSRWHKRARKAFVQVIALDDDARDMRVARFNLALLALVEGDEEAARTGLEAAAEQDRNLALVSPRFALVTVRGRVGSRIWLECHDRASDNELVAIEVGTLGRPVSPDERRRFIEQVEILAEIDHPALVRVREGVAEGRVFGVIMQPEQGVPLARLLEQTAEPLALDKAFELIGPLMEVVGLAHAKELVHRNLHPRHVLITQDGAKLRGFGFLPLVSWSRPAIVRENHGYAAPELFAGAAPSPASDTYALAAMLYRCITGKLPLGSVPAPSRLVTGIDMRVDALLAKAMHPDPEQRLDPKALRTEVATILTTPHKFDQVAAAPDEPATPAAPAKPTGPVKLVEPEDPDDLDAWKWILEQKSSHLPAREAISRIEREARAAQRWDRVAEVLDIRARSSQAESEKIVLLRELAEISEQRLDAPGSALDALLQLIDTISVNAQVPLVDDLLRLAEITGRWAAVAEKLHAVGRRVPAAADQLRISSRAALIYVEQVGDLGRAIAVYEDALDLEPENLDLQRAALVAYRKADRPAELATGLLTIAELESGPARHEALIEAAQILGDLGEYDGALEAAEHVRAEDPDNHRALEASERWARELDRWDLLAQVLPAQAAGNLDDADATALRKEAAEIMLEHLQDQAGAIKMYRQIIERDRTDKATAEALLGLLRPKTSGDSGEAASAREGLIDALSVLTEITEDTGRRAELLAEAATLLDREPDGGERAADCRERIVETMPVDHALVLEAVEGLIRFYQSQDAHEPLAELLERRAKLSVLELELRVSAYKQLQELAAGPLDDPARERVALEGLVELDPGEGRWRDLLIERLRDAGEQELAEQLLRQRIADADSPADRASMLVTVARMRERAGELEEAETRVREALELDDSATRAWALLREILEQRDRPLEALEAQIRAAQTSDDPRVKVRELFAAAKTWAETLNKPERALPLIREIVQLDPHHPGATGMLVERLVERGELKEAWPHAERWVAQTRAGSPEDRELNARVHALAGRCALAVGNNDEARELLRDAKQFDPRNRDVGRALADLELESESWDAALRAYQGLAIQTGDNEDPRAQAELYLRMGQARQGMGEPGKALQMIERALDLDPAYVDAGRYLVSLADSPVRKVEASQRLLTVLEAELASFEEHDDRREAKDQELLDLRLELATTLADQLNRPDEAVVLLRAVLARRPNDISLLHRSLDLFSNAEQWAEAVGVLDRLATLQDQGPIRAKYRYAAASLMRAHNLDTTGVVVRARLLGVLEADPLHDKAFKAVRDNLESSGEWRELSKVLRSRLKITPEDQPELRIELLDSIAAIYDKHLDDKRTAMIAYEQAITLTKSLGASDDDERQTNRRNKVISLSVQLGDDALDKGIEQVQALIRDNPLDYDSYHRLVELYLAAKQRDASIAVSRTLRFLKQADEAELELAAELGDNYQPPRGTISRKQWRDVVLPNHPSSRLSDLYGLLWPVMAAREGLTHASANVERSQRETVTMQASGVTRWIAYMAQIIDIPAPDLYLRKGELGGFRVTALGDPKGVYPSLLAGDDALGRQPDAALAFRAGRAVASTHPHLIGASVMPSVSSLRNAIYGAVGLTHPQVAIPKELREPARGWAEAIKKMLPPSRLDDLRKAVSKVIERGGADTKSWLRGCEHASARAGFLVSDSLDVSARVILQGGGSGSADGRELIKGLIAFSVSTPYLELRRSLKLS